MGQIPSSHQPNRKKTSSVDDEKSKDKQFAVKDEGTTTSFDNNVGKAKDNKKKKSILGSFSSFSTATQTANSMKEEKSSSTLTTMSTDVNNLTDIDAMIPSSTDESIGSPLSDSSSTEAEVETHKSFSFSRGSYSTFFPSGKSFISKIPRLSMAHFRLKDIAMKMEKDKITNTT
jgi:hypothetical protein